MVPRRKASTCECHPTCEGFGVSGSIYNIVLEFGAAQSSQVTKVKVTEVKVSIKVYSPTVLTAAQFSPRVDPAFFL